MAPSNPSSTALQPKFVIKWMLFLLFTSAILRLWGLADLPPGFWYDEAFNALDALHLFEPSCCPVGQTWSVFVPGNGGRATLFHHLGALTMYLYGPEPYTFRLVAVLFSLLSVALMYRWMITLLASDPDRYWLGLIGAAGLSFSFWYFILSRTGYRGAIIPCFYLLVAYLFWHGWQQISHTPSKQGTSHLWSIAGSGLVLGLSQYIYQPARLFPLVFGGFVLLWSIIPRTDSASDPLGHHLSKPAPRLKQGWTCLFLMALTSIISFLPLGAYFLQNPSALFGHTSSISVFTHVSSGHTSYSQHLLEALSVFWGGSAPHWQRNIVGEAGFHWLSQIGFWLGCGLALWRWRRPAYLFLLISLVILWLPGPLGVPAVDSLHLSGMYPPYYALMGLGLFKPAQWLWQKLWRSQNQILGVSVGPGIIIFLLVLCLNGAGTYQAYFNRWAPRSEVYYAYEGHVVDLVRHLIEQTSAYHVLIPFDFYTFPPTRFILYPNFPEPSAPPPSTSARPVLIVTDPSGNLPQPVPPHLWLTRNDSLPGAAYLLPPQAVTDLVAQSPAPKTMPFFDRHAEAALAQFILLPEPQAPQAFLPNYPPLDSLSYTFGSEARLVGYELSDSWIQPEQKTTLTLYWHLVGAGNWPNHQPNQDSLFIHVINPQGHMVTQFDRYFLRDWERWRGGKLFITQHNLSFPPETAPNTYLIRLGLFNPYTGDRYPVFAADGAALGDSVHLGLFYLSDTSVDPRQPAISLPARLGQSIALLGYTLTETQHEGDQPKLTVALHWQSVGAIDQDYTIFVQLLDQTHDLVATVDAQSTQGQYPTSLWQPGEIVVDTFSLTLPPESPQPPYLMVTGMYDLQTGQRLPVTTASGRTLANQALVLETLPPDWPHK